MPSRLKMFEINRNVVLVKGAKNAAVYNFNDGNIYSIDDAAYSIIYRVLIKQEEPKNDIEINYLTQLKRIGLLDDSFQCKEFKLECDYSIQLNFAWIELTQLCTHQCVHCYQGNAHCQGKNELTFEDWKRVLDQILDVGCRKIQFTGGEPCLSPYLKDLIYYASKIGFEDITVFTNASLLDDELINLFCALNIHVRFSLYGHCHEVHDTVTNRQGSFDKTIANVKKMINHKIDLYPSVIILKENELYIKEIKDFIESLGLEYKGYDVIRPACYGNQDAHMPTIPDVLYSKHQLYAHFKASREYFERALYRNTCWYGKIAVDSLGNVFPCIFQRTITYGNVLTHSVKDILSSSELSQGWFLDFSNIESCKDCEFRFACKDCRALGMISSNNMLKKNPRCMYNPYLGQWENPLDK